MRLKCWSGNFDGVRDALVIASSQAKAAKVLGCGVKSLKDWYCEYPLPLGDFKTEVLYTKLPGKIQWHEGKCLTHPTGDPPK